LWLFDEPGVWLHPAGQFDLIQALEALAQSSQIVYSTHSVFMINRNFPVRHRLVIKTAQGTQLDAKPFASRWSAALDALGFSMSGALLFAPCVLLAEGDADPVLIYPMLQRLAEAGLWDRDINSLSIIATGDLRNTEGIARLLLEGAHKPRIAVLVDGDTGGIARIRGLKKLVDEKKVTPIVLPNGTDTEDYIPDRPAYLHALAVAASEASGKRVEEIAKELEPRYEAWAASGLPGFGRWSSQEAKNVASLESAPSKVVVARAWGQAILAAPPMPDDLDGALAIAKLIDEALELPPRATESRAI
jgi:predicted ATP-dependent endonuclease of OLD family